MENELVSTAIQPAAVAQVLAAAPTDRLLAVVVETFQALGDPTRARILYALTQHSLCVRDLALVVGVSESAVSHQLRLLREQASRPVLEQLHPYLLQIKDELLPKSDAGSAVAYHDLPVAGRTT